MGVNDRSKALFEGMWPLPLGISYNSYLIDDQKTALVDTVDICYFEPFYHKLKQILGDRPVDYLIINHMEPDHSATLMELLLRYPNAKVVCNQKILTMIQQFFQLDLSGKAFVVK